MVKKLDFIEENNIKNILEKDKKDIKNDNINVRISTNLKKEFKKICEKNDTSMTVVLHDIIKNIVDNFTKN